MVSLYRLSYWGMGFSADTTAGTKVFAVLFTQAVNDHKTDPEAPILEDADLQVDQGGPGVEGGICGISI